MSGALRIRTGNACDAHMLARLHASSFPDAWPDAAFESLLYHPDAFVLLAARNSAFADEGFILVRVVAGEGEVLTFCVAAEARRCGLGDALLTAAFDAARGWACRQMFLEVSQNNESALALYQKNGFVEVGRRGAYYQHGAQAADALVMRKAF